MDPYKKYSDKNKLLMNKRGNMDWHVNKMILLWKVKYKDRFETQILINSLRKRYRRLQYMINVISNVELLDF